MTPTPRDKFRDTLRSLGGLYLNVAANQLLLPAGAPESQWGRMVVRAFEVLRWADLIAATTLRYRATREPLKQSDADYADIVESNPWYADHVKESNPLLAWRAQKTAEIEKEYLGRRLALARELAVPVPPLEDVGAYRIDRFKRDAVGEVAQVSEQIQLTVPTIGNMFPFVEYRTRDDARVRPTHHAMAGFVALRTWAGWTIARPKCGWNCRCFLRYYTKREAIAKGWMTPAGIPLFEVKWPTPAAESNWLKGFEYATATQASSIPRVDRYSVFPDVGWRGPKFWAATGTPAEKAA